jgi:hypothetical protein
MAVFACVSKERTVFFVRFGGKAAKTNKINVFFRPAAGEKALMWPASNADCVRPFIRRYSGA